jgi:antitoxin (DNA-binding transcriptional repressor) of toxin-antitoxin stability system
MAIVNEDELIAAVVPHQRQRERRSCSAMIHQNLEHIIELSAKRQQMGWAYHH